MQRQSLGSPLSNLNNHEVSRHKKDDTSNKLHFISPDYPTDEDDERRKSTKIPRRFSSSSASSSLSFSSSPLTPENFVHFIPLLTLLCFLLLFLVSHTPSPSDLAQFKGFKLSSKHGDSMETSDVDSRFGDRRGGVFVISNLRNLQKIAEKRVSPKSRIHRKLIADF